MCVHHKKMFKKLSLCAVLLTVAFLVSAVNAGAGVSLESSAVQFLKNDYQKNGLKNTEYDGVGSYAFYVLTQKGVDVSAWRHNGKNLREAVAGAVSGDIANAAACSSKLLAQDLAAAKALNRNDLADKLVQILKNRQTGTGFDNSIFYNIPAFDLLGRLGLISEINTSQAKNYILGQQNTAGGNDVYSWGFTSGGKYYPDLLVTAKAVRALNYLDPGKNDAGVQAAVENGLNWLKNQQKADGSFLAGYSGMDDPLNDTAEVIKTLKAFGKDPVSWVSAGNKSALDYLANNALNSDGSFGKYKSDMGAVGFLDASVNVSSNSNSNSVIDSSQPENISTQLIVSMAVVSEQGELLYGPSEVTVEKDSQLGLTVLGALDASGTPYHCTKWAWGLCVDSIAGVPSTGGGGWMYAVNGQIATKMPDAGDVNNGDRIIWYYAYSMDQRPPEWNDVMKLQQNAGTQGVKTEVLTGQIAVVSDSALNAAIGNAVSAGRVVLQADSTKTSLAISSDQLTGIKNTGKPLAVAIQGAQFVLAPDSLKVPEITAANASQLQLHAEKLSDFEVQYKISPFTGKFKLAGDVYELNMLVANTDDTRQTIKELPDCEIILPVPRGFREAAAAGTVMAYRYNETGKAWEYAGGAYDASSGTISFKLNHFSKYALLQTTGSFNDIDGHWAQKEIEFMAANGYVSGVGDNKFSPDTKVTRAEFVAILTKIAGLTADAGEAERFGDVPAGAWYRNAVNAAVNAGIVNGISKNSFAPDGLITREQMAAMIENLMTWKGLNVNLSDDGAVQALAQFADAADVSSWARQPVALAVREQLMAGRENDRFMPLGNATRAEAAAVLYRVLQKLL